MVKAREFNIGSVGIGGDHPISIQSMTTTKPSNILETINQISRLQESGCNLVRIAITDLDDCKAISEIKKNISIPLIADIQFDYNLAIWSIKYGSDKIRINPGNIKEDWKLKEIAKNLIEFNTPIRIGSNSGSLSNEIIEKYGVTPKALVVSAIRQAERLENMGVKNIVLSMKSSNVKDSIEAYTLASKECDYPLHIGITEAGTVWSGTIKSAVGIGTLLYQNIGHTLRVSLTGDPVQEVIAAREILKSLNLLSDAPTFISCPTCGRTKVNLIKIASEIEDRLKSIKKPITVAVMGCGVNGPGEAREADIGLAAGDGEGLIFKKGKIVKKIPESLMIEEFWKEIISMVEINC